MDAPGPAAASGAGSAAKETPAPPTRDPRGGEVLWTVVLLAVAFALRLGVAARMPIIEVDGAYWCGLGATMAHSNWQGGLHTAWPPLYPTLIAGVLPYLGGGGALAQVRLEWAARLVSVVAGTLLLLPLGSLSRRLLPGKWARAVLLVAAVHPRLVEYSAAALAESVFTLAVVGGIAALARGVEPKPSPESGSAGWQVMAGVCFGFGFLARPEALPLGLGLWLASWLVRGRTRPPGTRRSRVRPDFALAMIVVCMPWLIFLHHRTGGWTLGEKGTYNFWRAHREAHARHFPPPEALPRRVNRSPEIAPPPRPGEVRPFEILRREPGAVLGKSLRQLGTLLVSTYPVTIGWPVALLALAGFLVPRAGPWWVVWMPMAIAPLLLAPFSVDRRFLVPMVPLALPLAAAALAALGGRWRGWPAPALTAVLATGLLAYALGIPARADRAPELRDAGAWVREAWRREGKESGRPVVMARKPYVAFYSGGLIADLIDAPPESILADARRTGVDILVADARAARGDRPQIAGWLERAPDGWSLIQRRDSPEPVSLLGPSRSLSKVRPNAPRLRRR